MTNTAHARRLTWRAVPYAAAAPCETADTRIASEVHPVLAGKLLRNNNALRKLALYFFHLPFKFFFVDRHLYILSENHIFCRNIPPQEVVKAGKYELLRSVPRKAARHSKEIGLLNRSSFLCIAPLHENLFLIKSWQH